MLTGDLMLSGCSNQIMMLVDDKKYYLVQENSYVNIIIVH